MHDGASSSALAQLQGAEAMLRASDVRALLDLAHALLLPSKGANLLDEAELRQQLIRLFDVDFIGLALWDGSQTEVHQTGRDSGLELAYAEVRQSHSSLDQRMSAAARLRRGASLASALLPEHELRQTDYFNLILRPFEIQDLMGCYLRRGSQIQGNISLARAHTRLQLGPRELTLLTLLEPHLSDAVARAHAKEKASIATASFPELTPRERQVCELLLKGLTDAEIAFHLQMAYWTVRTHLHRIFGKLGTSNRVELAVRLSESMGGPRPADQAQRQ